MILVQKTPPLQEPHVKLGGCRARDGHVTSMLGRLTLSEFWDRISSRGIVTVSSAIEAVGVSGVVVTF